jgi:CarD family transcriptional regulator
MTARNKSKKKTNSRTKKTRSVSQAKSASKRAVSASKRTSKRASLSSPRKRVRKGKPTSSVRVSRKAVREKKKSDLSKVSALSRRNSDVGTPVRRESSAKGLVKVAGKKAAAAKGLSKAIGRTSVAKTPSIQPALLKEAEVKLRAKDGSEQEKRTLADSVVTPASAASGSFRKEVGLAAGASTVSAIKVQKAAAPEEPSSAKSYKTAGQRQGFKLNEFVVYPAHGVGQIIAIEEQEVAGFKLELFVINFSKDKLTLRVPTAKVSGVGMRKISDPDTARHSLEILTGRARVKRTMWSRRAQEYETKINSGDINAIAEVVRDLYRSEAQPEQSYSERQLYEAALDRMVREIAAVQKSSEIDALKTVEAQLQKGQGRASKPVGAQNGGGDIEQAA